VVAPVLARLLQPPLVPRVAPLLVVTAPLFGSSMAGRDAAGLFYRDK
jgi:hypothetical protein